MTYNNLDAITVASEPVDIIVRGGDRTVSHGFAEQVAARLPSDEGARFVELVHRMREDLAELQGFLDRLATKEPA